MCHQENAEGGGNLLRVVKVKFWSQVKEDVYEMWSDLVLSFDSSKAPEIVTVKGKDTDSVSGMRHRLQVPLTPDMTGR